MSYMWPPDPRLQGPDSTQLSPIAQSFVSRHRTGLRRTGAVLIVAGVAIFVAGLAELLGWLASSVGLLVVLLGVLVIVDIEIG
jgi:phage shock protein PspC (stress-responsive transcriptional regulator)